MTAPARVHKYRAQPVTIDGQWFASRAEAQRYAELRLYERAGLITGLARQPSFILHACHLATGELVAVGTYRADFEYRTEAGQRVIEDVKGMATLPLAKWKQAHLRAEYGIVVQEWRRG